MKPRKKMLGSKPLHYWLAILGACAGIGRASAADTNAPAAPATNAPPPLTPQQFFEGGEKSYDNWVDFTVGGFVGSGNRSQLQQAHQNSYGPYGGIDDFHLQKDLAKNTTLSVDGRAMLDDHDYRLKLNLEKEKLGYLRLNFSEFRTWYNGDGGFYPGTGSFYSLSDHALGLDRGSVSFEAGLRLDKKYFPDITLKYTHNFRDGDKGSTIWGGTHPDVGVTQGLSPSYYDIDEHRDIFQLDATEHIKATDFGAGVRFETGRQDNALKINQFPGEPVEQKVTDRQGTSYDLFSTHAFTETWLKKNLMFSSGFLYSSMDSSLFGSRVYGSDFDVGYLPSALAGAGYYNLAGGARTHEYVADLNLFYRPIDHLSIVPSLRIDQEHDDASLGALQTQGVNAPVAIAANSDNSDLDVRERLDITYNGLTNWVFYGRADLSEGQGSLNANGGTVPLGGIGVAPIQQQTERDRVGQKYSAGVRWYPLRAVTVEAGGYYKYDRFNYSHNLDSTPNNGPDRYPAYLIMQGFRTYDGNFRLTMRPWRPLTLTSRYEFQLSTVDTEPDPISGLSSVESSKMTSHILGEDITWSPWSRLYIQAGFNYVLSKTITPGADAVAALIAARNNYWMLNLNSGFVVDDKTDLNLAYFYYRANDYEDISAVGVPYGSGAEDQGITATLVRRLSSHVRVTLKYGCFHDADRLYGGNNNFVAQFVSTSLQYRF